MSIFPRLFLAAMVVVLFATGGDSFAQEGRIIFLHHSTGQNIWDAGVESWFNNYNSDKGTDYRIVEQDFPKDSPYGWENYPYDYWNIWVNNAGDSPFKTEPTLEILSGEYDLIIWKHCFPVSDIEEDIGEPDVASSEKRLENYMLQYQALKEKMHQFPETKFIVWTGAVQTKSASNPGYGRRAGIFFDWVRNDWDEEGDNIYIWDFYKLETEGGMFLKDAYAADPYDSHPNESFSSRVVHFFCRRVVNVIEGRGDSTSLTGEQE